MKIEITFNQITLKSYFLTALIFTFSILLFPIVTFSQTHQHNNTIKTTNQPKEEDYYQIIDVPIPKNVLPEVGGLVNLTDGNLVMATRRGEVWLIENPSSNDPNFKLIASGLHEPLGMVNKNNSLFLAQRSEITKLTDTNSDQKIDHFERIVSWPLSGNYCEYNHGPVIGQDGNFYFNMNLGDNGMGAGAEEFYGEMGSHADWRGWMMKVTPDGKMTPYAAGLRSPAGIGVNEIGEIFYTENQGGWVGTGFISHVEEGDFFGHPSSLKSAKLPGSPISITEKDIPRNEPLFHEAVKQIQGLTMPSVRIPHGILGISTSGFIVDKEGAMGPFFKNQFFVGDEGHAKIMRVSMEKINGKYQGAVYPFRDGFESGILRMEFGKDNSIFVGMSDRGWHSTGKKREGLQRLVWNNITPFEIQTINAKADGFEIHFTKPVDFKSLINENNYQIKSFDYLYHQKYGSDVMDLKDCRIIAILPSIDQKSVRLKVEGLREGYIHELKLEGIIDKEKNESLLHDFAFYSLNSIPSGDPLSLESQNIVIVKNNDEKELLKNTPQEPKSNKEIETSKDPKEKQIKTTETLEKRMNKLPKSWKKVDKTIIIGTKPGMKYDIESFNLKPNEKVKLTFKNFDDMQHNLLIVSPGSGNEIGELAMKMGLNGPKMNYIPKNKKVLFHTNLLQPKSEETIYFIAPEQIGKYEFICTYPGHYFIMRGIINIKN